MRINHQKHHKTYLENFNKTIEKLKNAVTKGCMIKQQLQVLHLPLCSLRTKACLPALKFHYKDLEPIESSYIMRINHQIDHKTYIDNFNKTIEK
ncbi:superoxide dismutase [Aphis craccivora]|uniref:superoxide dismutase n=1 Tax=Aphis craccivora TaxID=307492 RepID=A0A6G0VUS6_APHCR|nr:superoxide dismutase [Aphis craccivora]